MNSDCGAEVLEKRVVLVYDLADHAVNQEGNVFGEVALAEDVCSGWNFFQLSLLHEHVDVFV